ncbi:MAG: hypothetical protein M3Z22_03375 [Verrucomicrobiota bacterium]|nr:hypothetical protein [Verrucomicrobiota bacterium]
MTPNDSPVVRSRGPRWERKLARRQRLLIWAAALVIFVGGIAVAKPLYHQLKARRANHFAAEASALVQQGKLNDAASKYRAALQLDPLGYRPLAGAARLAQKGERPEALDLWQEVMRSPECTVEDRQEYTAFLLQRGSMTLAEKMLQGLLKNNPDARTLTLASQYESRLGNEAKALELARLAVARAPDDDAMRSKLAELLAKSTDEAQRAEARQILWLLAGRGGKFQSAALQALARAPDLSPEEEQRVLVALNELPDRTVVSDLLASELKLKMQPDAATQIYDEATKRWAGGETGTVAELARWLNLHQQAERVLSLLPPERAIASEPLLLSRLDALAALGRWREIDTLLQRPDLGLDPAVAESFRARNAMGEGSIFDANLHWDRAIGLAAGDPYKLRFVANFAEQSHATGAGLKAYDQLARFPEHAAFAQRGRQRLIEQTGDATAARTVAERLSTVAPDDVNAQAELVHLNLLLGADVEANLEKAKALAAKYPTRLSFRVTAALGYLRAHDAAGALAQFQAPEPIEWSRTPPSWRAVYAAALAANDQETAAREMLAKVPLDRLNKEERELVAPITGPPAQP